MSELVELCAGPHLSPDRAAVPSAPTGTMLAAIFAALAGYERELMHEHASASRAAARARGGYTGRPPRLSADQVRQVRALRAGGETMPSLMASYAASRATIYRALRHSDPYETATATDVIIGRALHEAEFSVLSRVVAWG